MEYKIEFMKSEELAETLQLVKNVFDEFEAPYYSKEGVQNFYQFANVENLEKILNKNLKIIVTKVENKIVGMIAIRDYSHIAMLFVDKKYHKNGIATGLVREAKKYCEKYHKNLEKITVNSSPYAVGFYEKIGFVKTSDEQIVDGIRFTPMKLKITILKKRFANDISKAKGILEIKQKMKAVNEKDFSGDVYLNYFVKMSRPAFLENGLCVRDNNYKWLQFYDYSSKVCLTTIYNAENEIVEWYFDVARKIGKENGIPYEDDLYLDVVLKPNGELILLDEDELKEAFERMEMTKEEFDEAYEIAKNLMKKLQGNQDKVKHFTDRYLREMLEKERKYDRN